MVRAVGPVFITCKGDFSEGFGCEIVKAKQKTTRSDSDDTIPFYCADKEPSSLYERIIELGVCFADVSKALNPDQRLKKLVKTAITQIEKGFGDKYLPAFHAAAVLESLSSRLKKFQAHKSDNFTILNALTLNEIKKIDACLNQACSRTCNDLLDTLKTERPVRMKNPCRAGATLKLVA